MPINTGGYSIPVMPQIQFQDPRLFPGAGASMLAGINSGLGISGQIQQQQNEAQLAPLQRKMLQAQIQGAGQEAQVRAKQLAQPTFGPTNTHLEQVMRYPDGVPAGEEGNPGAYDLVAVTTGTDPYTGQPLSTRKIESTWEQIQNANALVNSRMAGAGYKIGQTENLSGINDLNQSKTDLNNARTSEAPSLIARREAQTQVAHQQAYKFLSDSKAMASWGQVIGNPNPTHQDVLNALARADAAGISMEDLAALDHMGPMGQNILHYKQMFWSKSADMQSMASQTDQKIKDAANQFDQQQARGSAPAPTVSVNLGTSAAAPAATAATNQPGPDDISKLRAHPEMAEQFDNFYGQGAAEQYLTPQQAPIQ